MIHEFLLVAGIHLLAVMSPGPDFAMVIRNSLVYSRRTGILAAVGLALGILVHVTYSILGVALIISKSIVLFNALKLLGAAYLIYIGLKSLLHPRLVAKNDKGHIEKRPDISVFAAIRLGFLTNVLNPKATMFFLSLFTQVIKPTTPDAVKAMYGIEMAVVTFGWFALVAAVLSHRYVKTLFQRFQHYFEKAFGGLLVLLGIKVALSNRN